MQLIPTPEWARPTEILIEELFGEEEYLRLSKQREEVLAIVKQAIETYINDDNLCCDLEDMFPKRERLNGEYYIDRESYDAFQKDTNTSQLCWMFSIMVHCLEKAWYEDQIECDYLGLDIHFGWSPEEQKILFSQENIDSSSI
jgi:hypothetical protein